MPRGSKRALKAVREGDLWYVHAGSVSSHLNSAQMTAALVYTSYGGLHEMSECLQQALAVLLVAPVGLRIEQVGRRVTEDVFWVFLSGDCDG